MDYYVMPMDLQVKLWDAINRWAAGDIETKMTEVVVVHRVIAEAIEAAHSTKGAL